MNISKKSWIIVFLVIIGSITIGCANPQTSKRSDAETVAKQQEDFKEFVQYLSISATAVLIPEDPYINDMYPQAKIVAGGFVHQIFYRNKSDSLCCIFLNDGIPPKVILKIQ